MDLLPRLKMWKSDHWIRGADVLRYQPALGGKRRHTEGTLVCLPRRAVARSVGPHRIQCHRRGYFHPLCFRDGLSPNPQSLYYTGPRGWTINKNSECPLNRRVKTGVSGECGSDYGRTEGAIRGRPPARAISLDEYIFNKSVVYHIDSRKKPTTAILIVTCHYLCSM
mgnify:CR=1 FL=1